MFSGTRSRVPPADRQEAGSDDARAGLRARFGMSPDPTQNPRFHPGSRRTSSLPPAMAGSFLSSGSLSDSAMSVSSADSHVHQPPTPLSPVSPMSVSVSPMFHTPSTGTSASRAPSPTPMMDSVNTPTPRHTIDPDRAPTPRQPVVPMPTGEPAVTATEVSADRPATPELPTMWGRAERVVPTTHLSWQFLQSRLAGKLIFQCLNKKIN